ncbi:uncharacterized protein LOC110182895 [Drosophila serrata]|uniref:uncharacterized protein LOC110182895 n=1 Tax=Drosophila serrata TaxID=7274 RepID=UPI000A1D3876|nr:uncharacterized protein LOC110182895 [Drosophila serrata]KAH8374415.1 hypothetical protein KR200_002085 [Drosophila serrata]
MGLKRFVSSMLRSAQLRSTKAGELAAGCPPVFNKDGMWNAMVQRQVQNKATSGSGKTKENDPEKQSGELAPNAARLPRKRCWLTKRTDPQLQKK